MKRTGFFLSAAVAAITLAACGLGAPSYPDFEQTAYRLEGMTRSADNGAPTRTVIYRDGPQMRVEAVLPQMGQATIVFDQTTNGAYVLNPVAAAVQPQQPTAAPPQQPLAQPAQPTPTAPAPQQQAQTAAPAATGIAVRVEDADAPQPLETAWAALGADNARHVGRCEVAGEQGHEWTPREAPAPGVERTACITDDGIVLRVRENTAVIWEATSLQRGAQDPSMFGIPAGYQVIDPQRAAEEVGETMQQLDSVTGAPPAPQQAPAPRG